MSLTLTSAVQAQSINDFINSDDLEKVVIESVAKLNVPSYYKINDVKVVSATSFVLVGSYVDPNESNQKKKAWNYLYLQTIANIYCDLQSLKYLTDKS